MSVLNGKNLLLTLSDFYLKSDNLYIVHKDDQEDEEKSYMEWWQKDFLGDVQFACFTCRVLGRAHLNDIWTL